MAWAKNWLQDNMKNWRHSFTGRSCEYRFFNFFQGIQGLCEWSFQFYLITNIIFCANESTTFVEVGPQPTIPLDFGFVKSYFSW
jgi:hypothetical protein